MGGEFEPADPALQEDCLGFSNPAASSDKDLWLSQIGIWVLSPSAQTHWGACLLILYSLVHHLTLSTVKTSLVILSLVFCRVSWSCFPPSSEIRAKVNLVEREVT